MATSALNVYSSTVPHCYVQCAKWGDPKIIPRLVVIHGGPNKPSPSWSFISGVKNNHKQPLSGYLCGRFMIGFTKETPWDPMGFWDVSELHVSEMCPGNVATVIKAAVMMILVLQCQALQHTCNALAIACAFARKRQQVVSDFFPKSCDDLNLQINANNISKSKFSVVSRPNERISFAVVVKHTEESSQEKAKRSRMNLTEGQL